MRVELGQESEQIGSDEILGFYARGDRGLGLDTVTVIKGGVRINYQRALWGVFMDSENPTAIRLVFRVGKRPSYRLFPESIPYDQNTKVIIKAGPLPNHH